MYRWLLARGNYRERGDFSGEKPVVALAKATQRENAAPQGSSNELREATLQRRDLTDVLNASRARGPCKA